MGASIVQIKSFILGGMSYGGPHSSAIVAKVPDRVQGWFLLSPVSKGGRRKGLSGCSYHSGRLGSQFGLTIPHDFTTLTVYSQVVPALPDFSGWTARIKIPHLFFILNYLMVRTP